MFRERVLERALVRQPGARARSHRGPATGLQRRAPAQRAGHACGVRARGADQAPVACGSLRPGNASRRSTLQECGSVDQPLLPTAARRIPPRSCAGHRVESHPIAGSSYQSLGSASADPHREKDSGIRGSAEDHRVHRVRPLRSAAYHLSGSAQSGPDRGRLDPAATGRPDRGSSRDRGRVGAWGGSAIARVPGGDQNIPPDAGCLSEEFPELGRWGIESGYEACRAAE